MVARKRPLTGGEKLNLALGMVGYLGDHYESTIDELASQLGVSKPDIISVLKMVWLTERNGDSLFDFEFDLDQPNEVALGFRQAFQGMPTLSTQQVVALQAGLTKLATLPGVADKSEIEDLIRLLGQQLPNPVNSPIHITPGVVDAENEVLAKAIMQQRRIRFSYRNAAGVSSTREFDPIQLTTVDEDWIVRGYCHLKQSSRNFRVDRMHDTVILNEPICDAAKELEISQFLYEPGERDVLVTFVVTPEALKLMDDFNQDSVAEELEDGSYRFQAPIGDLQSLGPVLARYGGAARVVAPDEAIQAVVSHVRAALGLNNDRFADGVE